MTSIFEINGWNQVAAFFVWTLAVCAMAKAIFGSLPAAELQYRLVRRDNPRRQRLNRLSWEVANRTRWSDDVARGSPHAAPVLLADDEVEARRGELQNLTRTSLPWRALQYVLNCWACQTFWAAVAVFALTRGVVDVAAWFFSAAAYSGAAALVARLHTAAWREPRAPQPAQAGCKRCGK